MSSNPINGQDSGRGGELGGTHKVRWLFSPTNEIIQVKVMHLGTGKCILRNFTSDSPLTAYVRLAHKVERYPGDKFTSDALNTILAEVGCDPATEYWGWGVGEDKKMLRKYGVEMQINDIQDRLRLTDEYEERMAVEGSGLEAVHFLATGEVVSIDHSGIDELNIIRNLYDVAQAIDPREYLTVMPFGFARGMPISEYVLLYRRQADGYRLNNSDILASSLTAAIAAIPRISYHDYDDDCDCDYDGHDDDDSGHEDDEDGCDCDDE